MIPIDIIQTVDQMLTFLDRENTLLRERSMAAVLSMVDEKVLLLLRYKKAQEWIAAYSGMIPKSPPDSWEQLIKNIKKIIQLSTDNEDRLKRYLDASERVMGRLLGTMNQKNAQIHSYTASGRLQKPNFNGAFTKSPGTFQFNCQL